MLTDKLIGIDLFSGAGGLSLGAEMAGVIVKLAVEKDISAAATYRTNHPHVRVFNDDIREFTEIPSDIGEGQTVLFGGAPCQGFSTSNKKTNNRDNPQNWLYKEFVRVLKLWQPDWVVFENVTGLLDFESGEFFRTVLSDFENAGYLCSHKVLDATCFGVPQKRHRLFIVGSKHGRMIEIPERSTNKVVTVGEAFDDLPSLANGANTDVLPYAKAACNDYSKLMRNELVESSGHLVSRNKDYVIERYFHIKQGENWTAIPPHLMENYADCSRCHTGIYHRLRDDMPSVVIGNYRKNMLIHPWENRGLSVREAARLQSFPDGYQFKGSIGFQQQQVGNAVPPLLARSIFLSILNSL
jgi:DNA (cytosine-5)-methyltransferase 1